MPSWNDLLTGIDSQPDDNARGQWISQQSLGALQRISALRGGRHVIFYSSGFLQKPQAPQPSLQITLEDLNGLMAVMYGMDWDKGLTLLIHTPGGQTIATESLVAYMRSKFGSVEVIVPAFAMSAGTMISLSGDLIVMGRQSQLGPIDPQMPLGDRVVSARAVVDQFNSARTDIMDDQRAAHVWASILQSMGPSLLQEAENALRYGQRMVETWLEQYMFAGDPDGHTKAAAIAKHFNDASLHLNHGRRIGRDEAIAQGVTVEPLEDNQDLQEAVLTAYHIATILFEKGPATKIISSDTGRNWVKNMNVAQPPTA